MQSSLLIPLLTALLGLAVGWLLGRERTRRASAADADTLRDQLTVQFKVLAAEMLEEKGRTLTDLHRGQLTTLLQPLQDGLNGFRQKVEEAYVAESKDRSALAAQVQMLSALNATLRDETSNLTKALRGDSKAQGDWGELVLERLLESAGLMEGEHYTRQASARDDEGALKRPDVVLHLPGERHMVVDSKVTLTAYTEYAGAEDAAARDEALKRHLASVRNHVKGLSGKNYQQLYGLQSPDFVVLFLPLEGAFMAAVTGDRDLATWAAEQRVLLVSPSTLLFMVRTVASLWQQQAQSRNLQEIVDRGGKLYDKFVGFTEDLEQVGLQLARATKAYEGARAKLSVGTGNLVGQAEKLRKLGVRTTKQLPAGVGDDAE